MYTCNDISEKLTPGEVIHFTSDLPETTENLSILTVLFFSL